MFRFLMHTELLHKCHNLHNRMHGFHLRFMSEKYLVLWSLLPAVSIGYGMNISYNVLGIRDISTFITNRLSSRLGLPQ